MATTLTTADETAISEREPTAEQPTEDFENSAEMEQLAAAIAELAKFQQEQERRCTEEQEREAEQKRQQETLMKQQHEEHQEQVKTMHEQHQAQLDAVLSAIRDRRPSHESHLKITPLQETEDVQDFLDAFEGIMRLQHVEKTEWVLRLTPLLNGRARTVCTDLGTTADYDGVKKAILDHYNINPERCRKQFRTHSWTRDAEPNEWVARGLKLMLHPDEGLDQVLEKIAVEQFLNALPQELRIWVASQNPTTPTKVAELIELYDSAHNSNTQGNRKQPLDPKSTPKTSTKELAGKPRGERWARNNYSTVREKKPLAEVVCFKCGKKGHLARNCTEKTFHAQGVTEKVGLFGEGEVNG